jgi:chromosome partitioning protein
MHIVSIYNNKGGVGKSTLTVGLAEFLASNRNMRVLVIDLDAQASSSGSLLGRLAITQAISSHRTVADLVAEIVRTRRPLPKPSDFFTTRPASEVRGTALVDIDVLVPEKTRILELEDSMTAKRDVLVLREFLRPSLREYDFVLIDLPGNVDKRNRLAISALIMSDFVLIPAEPSQISLNALPDTFDLVSYARDRGGNGRPTVLGIVLNKTDKRTEQYRSKLPDILESANKGMLPPVFTNFLPDTPKLATATDETLDFQTLKDRFDTYYDNVRKVAVELHQRCDDYEFIEEPEPPRFGQRVREILDVFSFGRKRKRTVVK